MSKHELAKMIDKDSLVTFEKIDNFLEIINTNPPESWLEEHPLAKGVKYLPIGTVELLLTKIFQEWKIEILREGQLANSIYCTVRLHYKNPLTGWTSQDGTAAVPIKTDKGESAANMAAIKNDAVQTGLPAAESFAIKDAADKIGKLFGRDINRKGVADFVPSYTQSDEDKLLESFRDASTAEEIDNILSTIPGDQQRMYAQVAKNRLAEIKNAA